MNKLQLLAKKWTKMALQRVLPVMLQNKLREILQKKVKEVSGKFVRDDIGLKKWK